MPLYIFKVSKQSPQPSVVGAFHKELFGEVSAYRLANALLKRLRSRASPADDTFFYKVYGSTEREAQKRLTKQLRPKDGPKRPPSSTW